MQKQYVQSEEAVVTRVTIGQSIGNAIANEEVEKKHNCTCGLKRRWWPGWLSSLASGDVTQDSTYTALCRPTPALLCTNFHLGFVFWKCSLYRSLSICAILCFGLCSHYLSNLSQTFLKMNSALGVRHFRKDDDEELNYLELNERPTHEKGCNLLDP